MIAIATARLLPIPLVVISMVENEMDIPRLRRMPIFIGGGGEDRTPDLGVMNLK